MNHLEFWPDFLSLNVEPLDRIVQRSPFWVLNFNFERLALKLKIDSIELN